VVQWNPASYDGPTVPQRPRSHQVSDESRRAFERALGHWVFRPEQPDYGIDGEVEVFEESGKSTGLRFHVQLKATDGTVEQARSVRIERDTARYYHALDLPVLIVSYHAPSETLYARWFQELNPPTDDEGDGTITVKFDDANRWTSETPSGLVRDLVLRRTLRSGDIPTPIFVAVDRQPSDIHPVLVHELTSLLAPLRGVVELTSEKSRALASIVVRPRKLAVELGREISRSMGLPENVKNYRVLAADTLLLLAHALGRARQSSLAAKIALAVADEATIFERPEIFGNLTKYLAEGHRLADALELSDRLATKYGSTWAGESLRTLALMTEAMSAAEAGYYEKYLDREIERAESRKDKLQIGIAYYNRGNYRRGTGRLRDGIRDYLIAARTDATYWDRDYFCAELGGGFFGAKRFKCAVACYQKSIDLGAGLETRALLADSMMFAGQYKNAKEEFGHYLDKTKELAPQWRLKNWALTKLLEHGVEAQTRQTRAALSLAGDPDTLDDALKLDALCGLAWFNKGANELPDKDRRVASAYYLMAAVCQDWDLQAWRNAFGLAMEDKEDETAPYILLAAYEVHGERFIQELSAGFNGPVDKRAEYIGHVRHLISELLPHKQGPREIRWLGPDSEYVRFDLRSGEVTHRKSGTQSDEGPNRETQRAKGTRGDQLE